MSLQVFALLCFPLFLALFMSFPTASGPRKQPAKKNPAGGEEKGVNPACILGFLQETAGAGMENHSLLIMHHDEVIFESYAYPYAAEIPHEMFSVTKSIVGTAVGFAIAEGKFSLDTKVVDLFADYEHDDDPRWEKVTVESLLTMNSGKKYSFLRDMSKGSYTEDFMKAPFRKKSGFLYSNDDVHMLAAAVARAAGEPLVDYLMPRLFEPLDIEKPAWETDAQGFCVGGTGLYLKTGDVAKICNCYLNRGRHRDRQVIPEEWALAAGEFKVETDEGEGYGYLFWCNDDGSYKMGGMYGQYGVVYPQHRAVVVLTGCALDELRLSEIFDQYFPRAFAEAAEEGSAALLERFLQERDNTGLPVSAKNPLEEEIEGKSYRLNRLAKGFSGLVNNPVSIMPMALNVTFAQRPQESMDRISFEFAEESCTIRWREGDSRVRLVSGREGKPRFSEIERCGYPFLLWSYCYWQGPTLIVVVKPITTVATQRFEFTFKKGRLSMKVKSFPDFGEFARLNAVHTGQIPDIKVITPALLLVVEQALRYTRLPLSFKA